MPQEQFQQLMGMMNAGGVPGGGMGGMGGMPPGAGAGAGGNVIRLSEEEGAAVARLTELGFDRTDAAQVRGLLIVLIPLLALFLLFGPCDIGISHSSHAACHVQAEEAAQLLSSAWHVLFCVPSRKRA